MGILRRNADGTYSYERGRVPWADAALDAIAAEDRAAAERAVADPSTSRGAVSADQWEHWACVNCDSVDGPSMDGDPKACALCAEVGESGLLRELAFRTGAGAVADPRELEHDEPAHPHEHGAGGGDPDDGWD